MTKFYKINDLKEFIIMLMETKTVDAVIVPMKSLTGSTYSPFLIKDIKLLENAEPVSPVMSVNSAKAVSSLTSKESLPFKTAVILKPCELRAFRELVKLNQINSNNIITVSFDCEGIRSLKNNEIKREICEMCTTFTPEYADIQIYSMGLDEKVVTANVELKALQLEEISFSFEAREKAISKKSDENTENRKGKIKDIKENFKELLRNCISCHNCMKVCPICFCNECFFESSAVEGNSVTYLMRAGRMKGLKFPENKLLFHLGRMNHMSVSCVGCGACEDACPAEIPVSQMFAAAGDELKALFNYEPGREINEKVPFTCYQHDELHSFEKPYIEKIK